MKKTNAIISLLLALIITLSGCATVSNTDTITDIINVNEQAESTEKITEETQSEIESVSFSEPEQKKNRSIKRIF